MIILVTYTKKINGYEQQWVSHGVNMNTLQNVVLPDEPLYEFHAGWSKEFEGWVIRA